MPSTVWSEAATGRGRRHINGSPNVFGQHRVDLADREPRPGSAVSRARSTAGAVAALTTGHTRVGAAGRPRSPQPGLHTYPSHDKTPPARRPTGIWCVGWEYERYLITVPGLESVTGKVPIQARRATADGFALSSTARSRHRRDRLQRARICGSGGRCRSPLAGCPGVGAVQDIDRGDFVRDVLPAAGVLRPASPTVLPAAAGMSLAMFTLLSSAFGVQYAAGRRRTTVINH